MRTDSDEAGRPVRRRLAGVLIFAPILIAVAMLLSLPERAGAAATMAAISLTLAAGCLGVLVSTTLRTGRWLGAATAIAGVPALAVVIAACGGFASPAALLLAVLPLEAYWVHRTRGAVLAGLAGAIAAGLAQSAIASQFPALSGVVGAWQWLLPLGYSATLWLRRDNNQTPQMHRRDEVSSGDLADVIDGVVLRFSRAGDVTAAGDAARRLLNLAPELLHGTGLFERIHVADRVRYMCVLGELRDGGAPARLELRLRLPKAAGESGPDNYQPFTLDLAPRHDSFVAILRDHSAVADLRATLAEAVEKSESLDVAKGRFLAAVSHELRTPLNAIIGFSEILLHELFGGFTDPRQREYAELIKESGDHLLGVVNAILDVSKVESGTYAIHSEAFAFGEAAESCRAMMSLQAERRRIDLRTQIGNAVGDVVADRRAVQQILINLVANAVKFTPEGGTVVIGAQRLGSRLHFWVSDTGIGIAACDLDRIGRPFTQIRNDYTRQFEGTGLGLSLVKGLVALHEGTMSIESAPGEGTKVAISLPVDGPKPAAESDPAEPQGRPHNEVNHGALRKTA